MITRNQVLNKFFEDGHIVNEWANDLNLFKKGELACLPNDVAEEIACTMYYGKSIRNCSKLSNFGHYDGKYENDVIEKLMSDNNCNYHINGFCHYNHYLEVDTIEEEVIIDYHYNDNVTTFEFIRVLNKYNHKLWNCELSNITIY